MGQHSKYSSLLLSLSFFHFPKFLFLRYLANISNTPPERTAEKQQVRAVVPTQLVLSDCAHLMRQILNMEAPDKTHRTPSLVTSGNSVTSLRRHGLPRKAHTKTPTIPSLVIYGSSMTQSPPMAKKIQTSHGLRRNPLTMTPKTPSERDAPDNTLEIPSLATGSSDVIQTQPIASKCPTVTRHGLHRDPNTRTPKTLSYIDTPDKILKTTSLVMGSSGGIQTQSMENKSLTLMRSGLPRKDHTMIPKMPSLVKHSRSVTPARPRKSTTPNVMRYGKHKKKHFKTYKKTTSLVQGRGGVTLSQHNEIEISTQMRHGIHAKAPAKQPKVKVLNDLVSSQEIVLYMEYESA